MRLLPAYSLTCLSLLISSCQLLPSYRAPIAPTPDEWKNPSPVEETKEEPKQEGEPGASWDECRSSLECWWEMFNDPTLTDLIQQAIDSSYTLDAALERVYEAQALARIEFSNLYPQINLAPYFTRSGVLFQNPITSISGLTPPGVAPPTLPKDFRFVESTYSVPLNLTYEIDLWNKLHNQYDAAVYRAQASADDYYGVLLTLTTDVAISYFQVRDLDLQKQILENTIKSRKEAYDINKTRFQAGLSLYMDVLRAEVEWARAESDKADVIRLRAVQENTLATLVGTPASIFTLPENALKDVPPVVPPFLPSELLTRRPDIASAERNLAAAYADVQVAFTHFFPSLNLTAAIGYQAPFIEQLFLWKSRFWEFGMSALQTIFDAGRNVANYDLYRARFREAMANYEETVLKAFQDVEDALADIEGEKNRAEALAIAVKSGAGVLELSNTRYTRGLVNYLDVVDAERTLLEVEQSAAITLGERYSASIRLIKALGGGWEVPCVE